MEDREEDASGGQSDSGSRARTTHKDTKGRAPPSGGNRQAAKSNRWLLARAAGGRGAACAWCVLVFMGRGTCTSYSWGGGGWGAGAGRGGAVRWGVSHFFGLI